MSRSSHAGVALSADHLAKRFGDRVAFQDLSFEIVPGEVGWRAVSRLFDRERLIARPR